MDLLIFKHFFFQNHLVAPQKTKHLNPDICMESVLQGFAGLLYMIWYWISRVRLFFTSNLSYYWWQQCNRTAQIHTTTGYKQQERTPGVSGRPGVILRNKIVAAPLNIISERTKNCAFRGSHHAVTPASGQTVKAILYSVEYQCSFSC